MQKTYCGDFHVGAESLFRDLLRPAAVDVQVIQTIIIYAHDDAPVCVLLSIILVFVALNSSNPTE